MSSGPSISISNGTYNEQIEIEQYESELKAIENETELEKEMSLNRYEVSDSLKNHIENAEPISSGKRGIKGAHNKDNFISILEKEGAIQVKSEKNSQIEGVEKISYKMPKKDGQGNLTGEYQKSIKMKTVYNPNIISTDNYIRWGLEAANNAASKLPNRRLGHEWSGVDNQGVRWRGYCNKDGEITSFYPED